MKQTKSEEKFDDKWTYNIGLHGFTMVPNLLLSERSELKISASELCTLLNLENFRWQREAKVYPGLKTLSKMSGVSTRTITTHVKSLEAKGYILVNRRGNQSNQYDIEPLVKRLDFIAKEREGPRSKTHSYVEDWFAGIEIIS